VQPSKDERERLLSPLVTEFTARAGSKGFKASELIEALRQLSAEFQSKRG
jgi:GntR family transcriptional regulator